MYAYQLVFDVACICMSPVVYYPHIVVPGKMELYVFATTLYRHWNGVIAQGSSRSFQIRVDLASYALEEARRTEQ